ncbi:MAG: Serine/threonine-protein kinase PknD [Myxococcota bacterium]|nr:Serine/threonine-protein kinase PknD [Myxococcota bacterium]
MAEIFKAKSIGAQGFEKVLVIKRILPELLRDKTFIEMFVDEAKLTVALMHSNIVQVFDLGEVDGQLYMAMEYVRGKDLFDVTERCYYNKMQIPEELSIHIIVEALKGLDYAHSAKGPNGESLNLVHRDISPTNIFISYDGMVKLADFGIAKAAHRRQQTQAGSIKGTMGYMSPEQVVGAELDYRSDLFATGVILYELTVNRKPFSGKTDLETLIKIRDANFPAPREVRADFNPLLEKIIMKSMAKEKDKRYQSAADFGDDLTDYLFNNGMRTSQRMLATFMKSLFADQVSGDKEVMPPVPAGKELEAKKKQVREQSSPEQPVSAIELNEIEITSMPDQPASSISARVTVPAKQPPPPQAAERSPTAIRSKDDFFFIRTAGGHLLGPVDARNINEMGRNGKLNLTEKISKNQKDWLPITEFKFDSDVLDRISANLGPIEIVPPTAPPQPPSNQAASGGGQSMTGELEPKYSGTFTEVSPTKLFYRFAASRVTGKLVLTRDKVIKEVYLRDGFPEYVRSNLKEELLGEYLVNKRAITRGHLNAALSALGQFGGRLGDALLAINALPAHQLFSLLAQQVKEKTLEIFGWKKGKYSYFENATTNAEVIPLGIGSFALITEGVRIYMTLPDFVRALKDLDKRPVKYVGNPSVDLESLKLLPRESRVPRHMDGKKTVDDLISELGKGDEEGITTVYRVVYLLNELEALEFK